MLIKYTDKIITGKTAKQVCSQVCKIREPPIPLLEFDVHAEREFKCGKTTDDTSFLAERVRNLNWLH